MVTYPRVGGPDCIVFTYTFESAPAMVTKFPLAGGSRIQRRPPSSALSDEFDHLAT